MPENSFPVFKEVPRAAYIDPLMIDAKRLAQLLGVSESFVRKMDRAGKIPCPQKIGSCVRWRLDEIQAWVRADCPERQRWVEVRATALASGGRLVAPSGTIQKHIPGAAA